jgi:hypothetical protein
MLLDRHAVLRLPRPLGLRLFGKWQVRSPVLPNSMRAAGTSPAIFRVQRLSVVGIEVGTEYIAEA